MKVDEPLIEENISDGKSKNFGFNLWYLEVLEQELSNSKPLIKNYSRFVFVISFSYFF